MRFNHVSNSIVATSTTNANLVLAAAGTGQIELSNSLLPIAGTTTNPAIRLQTGVTLTSASSGAVEWDGANLFITQASGPTRKTIAYTDSNITGSAASLTTSRTIAVSGDGSGSVSFNGTANVTIGLTLATIATAGTYNSVVVNAKGLVTSGSSIAYLTAETDTLAAVTGRGATTSTALSITNATGSTSTGTGALTITGGLGVGGTIWASAFSGPLLGNATTATSAATLTTGRTIATSGDATGSVSFNGSANVTIALTLATVATAGTFNNVVVNAKGLVTSGSTIAYLTAETDTLAAVTGRGATTSTAISITNATGATSTTTGALVVTGGVGVGGTLWASAFSGPLLGNATTATSAATLTTARDIALSGDATGSVSFNGSANATISATLANTTVTPGTYTVSTIVVDAKGRITSASSGTGGGAEVDTLATVTGRGATTSTAISITNTGTFALSVSGGVTVGGRVLLAAGTTTVPALQFPSGVTLTTAVAGAMEWNGSNLFITTALGPTRRTIAYIDSAITGSAASLTTARNIALAGDVTGLISFNGTADSTITANLAIVNASAVFGGGATYSTVVVNGKGLVLSGTSDVAGGTVTAGNALANNIVMAGSASTNPVTITAGGSDTNVDILLSPKGTSGEVRSTRSVQIDAGAAANFVLNKTVSTGYSTAIQWETGGQPRWRLSVSTTETGLNNVGSDMFFQSHTDGGTFLSNVIGISRATGVVNFASNVGAPNLRRWSVVRALPTASGDTVDIGTFSDAGLKNFILRVTMSTSSVNYIFSGEYTIIQRSEQTIGEWYRVPAENAVKQTTGSRFDLEACWTSGDDFALRIRRASNTTLGNMFVLLEYTGETPVFTESSTITATPAEPGEVLYSAGYQAHAEALPLGRPSIYLPFVSGVRKPREHGFERATPTNFFDKKGNLVTYKNNTVCCDYDPATLSPRGLFLSGAFTNGIRNPNFDGVTSGVIGSGGVLPTETSLTVFPSGITATVTTAGTLNNVRYFDLRLSGTSTAGVTSPANFRFLPNTGVGAMSATNATYYSCGVYIGLAAGSMSNLTAELTVTERDGAGGFLLASSTPVTPTIASLMTQYWTATRLTSASPTFVTSEFIVQIPNAIPIDVTFRFALPVLLQRQVVHSGYSMRPDVGTVATSSISGSGYNILNDINPREGTLLVEFAHPAGGLAEMATRGLFLLSDGTNNNRIYVRGIASGANLQFAYVIGGSATTINGFAYPGQFTPSALCIAYDPTTIYRAAHNDLNVDTVSADVLAMNLNRLILGRSFGNTIGTEHWNGWIRNVMYWPYKLPNQQILALVRGQA